MSRNFPSAILLLCLTAGLSRACRHFCDAGADPACDADPGPCDDGEAVICGRRVCARGPGDDCGGPDNKYGVCGDGMSCQAVKPGMRGHCVHCSRVRVLTGLEPKCAWIYRNIVKYH